MLKRVMGILERPSIMKLTKVLLASVPFSALNKNRFYFCGMNSKGILFLLLCCLFLLSSCGKEKKEEGPPPLKAIEIPETITGLYVGELPCDDCKKKQVKVELDSLGQASIEEMFIQDSVLKVSSKASYVDSGEVIVLTFNDSPKKWTFKKQNNLSLVYLDLSGKPYYMDSGIPYQVLKILNKPKQ